MQNDNQMLNQEALHALGAIADLSKVLPTCIYFCLDAASAYVMDNNMTSNMSYFNRSISISTTVF